MVHLTRRRSPWNFRPRKFASSRAFGYLYFPQLFAPDEIAWITEEFERSIQAHGNGAQHDGSKRTMFGGPIEHRERLCTLVDDERIVGICNGVLGENFNYASGDGNYYKRRYRLAPGWQLGPAAFLGQNRLLLRRPDPRHGLSAHNPRQPPPQPLRPRRGP